MSELENTPKRGPGRPPKARPEFLREAPTDDVRLALADIAALVNAPRGEKIRFDAVLLKTAITRIGGHKGLASTDTAKFSVEAGNTIELDTTTNLVTISKHDEAVCVNREDCAVLYPFKPEKA